jgi:hypothetical protein
MSTFECSSKEGFKMIPREVVGYVLDDWKDYHKEGYIYLEKGY